MSIVYINKDGAKLSTESNRIVIGYRDGQIKTLPIESVEGISLLGSVQITTQCMEA